MEEENGKRRKRAASRKFAGFELGLVVSAESSDPGDLSGIRRLGLAMLTFAGPEKSCPKLEASDEKAREWASRMVGAMAEEMRRRGWVMFSPEESPPEAFRYDQDFAEMSFGDRKGEGWSLRPGWFAYAEARVGGKWAKRGSDAELGDLLWKALADWKESAEALGLCEIEPVEYLEAGSPGKTRELKIFFEGNEEERAAELAGRVAAFAQREALGAAAEPAAARASAKRKL